ncbi:hypothetical protein FRB90_007941 [Tulasnella sp. 427]|nr:hypothetical protein FRB90_007941 [Tulasnella sp. 427]
MSTDPAAFNPIQLSLPSFSPSLAVEVIPYGLTIHRILVNGDGKTHDLLIGPQDPQEHGDLRRFMNTIVGRYSNRIPTGDFTLQKNGITSQLHVDGNQDAEVQLHGGHDGFDKRVFTVIDPTDFEAYTLFSGAEKEQILNLMPGAVIFKLSSPDKDEGYPGKLDLEVLVAVVQPADGTAPKLDGEYQLGSVVVVYRAKVEGEGGNKTVTPVNLTQPLTQGPEADQVPVELSSKQTGIRITFETNQPGVQFYTGNGLDGSTGSRKKIHGGSGSVGDGYQPQTGAFLEFHEPLAAWQHPWGESHGDTLLTSDELYNNYTKLNVYFKPNRA